MEQVRAEMRLGVGPGGLFGDGDDPTPDVDTSSGGRKRGAKADNGADLGVAMGRAAKRTSGSKKGSEIETPFKAACRAGREAYSEAYERRYRSKPVFAAKQHAQMMNLVKQLGEETAPVLRFYVGVNKQFYVSKCHDLGLALTDAPALRTQWATGKQVTEAEARRVDKDAGRMSAFANVLNQIDKEGES